VPADATTRIVDRVWISHAPVAFRELCERAIPPQTRLVVLDLDRTLHLDRNMGELLGWEISAYRGYGPAYLTVIEPRRGTGRMALSLRHPLATLRCLAGSGRVWVGPGLHYLVWGKIAARVPWLRRRAFHRFGPEPVHAVQRRPQDVLFQQIATLPPDVVHELASRVWARHAPDQTVEQEDLAWLRHRCPGARIVLSTASPGEVAEVAARELGFDEVLASAPGRINGGRAKLVALRERFPELGAEGAVTVGISDTGYGEDHCWTEAFTHVVDVNSQHPFPPLVASSSPLRAVFSALVLTRAEKQARARGEAALDARRGRVIPAERSFGPGELSTLLSALVAALDQLGASAGATAAEVAYRAARLQEQARRMLDRQLTAP
jgi:hypothetical protein